MSWILLIAGTLLALFLMRIVITTVHEMGHAIAAYILTGEQVVIYLGSYGDQQKSRRLLSGKFELWVPANPLLWRGGLCKHAVCSSRQQYLIILAGPLASFLLFGILLSFYFAFQPQGLLAAYLIMFCVWSGYVFLYNIVPGSKSIDLSKGDLTYTDGTKLRLLRLSKKMSPDYEVAMTHLEAGRNAEAVVLLDKIIEDGTKNEFVYRMTISAYMMLKDYRKADQVQKEQVAKIGNLNTEDRINMALLKTHLGKYEEAVNYYTHLMQTGGDNKYNLNNFGYTLTLIDRYEEAIPYLDKAIAIDKDFAAAYCNRAFANLRMGALEQGKADNDIALTLDPKEAHTYRNAGIYLFDKGLYEEALVQLHKAKEMDSDTYLIDHYIERVNNWIR